MRTHTHPYLHMDTDTQRDTNTHADADAIHTCTHTHTDTCLCLYNLCGVLQLEPCHSEAAEESGAGGDDRPSTAHRQSESDHKGL